MWLIANGIPGAPMGVALLRGDSRPLANPRRPGNTMVIGMRWLAGTICRAWAETTPAI
jgi:hypothetical protein